MVRLVLLLLGTDYLRKRSTALLMLGLFSLIAGAVLFIDALDGSLYFPLKFFASILLIEGLATLAVAGTGVGGQRLLRYVKGLFVTVAAVLILLGQHHGNFILSMIFGSLFLADGLLQSVSAHVVRFPRWRFSLVWAVLEIALAIFFYQPYPDHYTGTVPYCLGVFLFFAGSNLVMLSLRVRALTRNPTFATSERPSIRPDTNGELYTRRAVEWDGPPKDDERALTVHIWTPVGLSKTTVQHYPIINRYIAAVGAKGVTSAGHAAIESPEGVYISLCPVDKLDGTRFAQLLRATRENDVPGFFRTDYLSELQVRPASTARVRIRNYDPAKLAAFWASYQKDKIYNLTHRNCSSSVVMALEAAIDGAIGRLHGDGAGWSALVRVLMTPELWVATQIRKRAVTMAWTPGLALDYARALSMLADPRPFTWRKAARRAALKMARLRREWRVGAIEAGVFGNSAWGMWHARRSVLSFFRSSDRLYRRKQ